MKILSIIDKFNWKVLREKENLKWLNIKEEKEEKEIALN